MPPRQTTRSVTPAAPIDSDGRRARADHSRSRIAEAMLALVREGIMAPSADLVAERAGVGRRTVFRLFDDMEGVYAEMHALMMRRLQPILEAPLEGATWRERLDALIQRRARLYEEMLPVKAASDAHRYNSPFLQEGHAKTTAMLRDVALFIVPRTIDRVRLEALDLALSFEAWRRLRQEQKLSPREAEKVVLTLAARLLD